MKFQRRFANNFSFLNSYTFGKSMDFASDNEAGHHQHLRPAVQPRAVGLRRQAHLLVELDLRAAVGPQRCMAAGRWRHHLPARRPAADRDADARRAVHGTGNRPNRICDGTARQSDDRSLVRHQLFRADRRTSPAPSAMPAAGSSADRVRSTSTHRSSRTPGSVAPQPRFGIEAFNLLNHPQFANPNTTIGNPPVGTISAMLSSPKCSLCGTIERQVQLGVKLRF